MCQKHTSLYTSLLAQERAETSKSFYTDGLSTVRTNLNLCNTGPAWNRTCKDSRLIQDFYTASKNKKKEKSATFWPSSVCLKWHWILSIITFNIQLFCCYSWCPTPLFWGCSAPYRTHSLPSNSRSKQSAVGCITLKIHFHFVNWMQSNFKLVYNRLLSAAVSATLQDMSVTFLCCVSTYVSYRESLSLGN